MNGGGGLSSVRSTGLLVVVVIIGDQWLLVVVCDISTRSDNIIHLSPTRTFHPQLWTRTVHTISCSTDRSFFCATTKYSAGPSWRWMMMTMTIIYDDDIRRRTAACDIAAAYRRNNIFCTFCKFLSQ